MTFLCVKYMRKSVAKNIYQPHRYCEFRAGTSLAASGRICTRQIGVINSLSSKVIFVNEENTDTNRPSSAVSGHVTVDLYTSLLSSADVYSVNTV